MHDPQEFLALVQRLRQQLDDAAGKLIPLATSLALARPVNSAEASEQLASAHRLSEEVRRLVVDTARACDLEPRPWSDAESLDACVQAVAERLRLRQQLPRHRLRQLAAELARGRAIHRRPGRGRELERLREQAARELADLAEAGGLPPELPGPGEEDWLRWWWQQDGANQEQVLGSLPEPLATFRQLLDQLEPDNWHDDSAPHPEPTPTATVEDTSRNAAGTPVNGTAGIEAAPVAPARLRDVPATDGGVFSQASSPVLPASPAPTAPERTTGAARTAPAKSQEPPEPQVPATPREPPPLPPPPPPLEPALVRFEAFRATYWIAPSGRCELAPWASRNLFATQLREAADRGFRGPNFLHLYLLSRAAEQQGAGHAAPQAAEVKALAAVWAHPLDSSAGLDDGRAAFLAEATDIGPGPRWRLAVFLEAIRPTRDRHPLSLEDADALVEAAAYSSAVLEGVIRGLLQIGVLGADPVPLLREAYRTLALESPEVLQKRLAARRQELHATVKHLWKAAGGTIQRTHCREAWDDFVALARPIVEELYPEDKQGHADWDVESMRQRIGRLFAEHTRIADGRGVKYQDRSAADRAARRIAQAAAAVNDLREQLRRAGGQRAPAQLSVPVEAVRTLARSGPLPDALEECCRLTLLRQLEPPVLANGEAGHDPLDITAGDLLDHPDWLGLIDSDCAPDLDRGRKPPHTLFHADDITDPVRAAAGLFTLPAPTLSTSGLGDPLERLLGRLAQHPDRALAGRLAGLGRDQGQAHIEASDRLDTLRAGLARLHQLVGALDALGGDAEPLRTAENQLARLLDDPAAAAEHLALLGEWLDRLTQHAQRCRDHHLALLGRLAAEEPDPDRRTAALAALERGAFALVPAYLHGHGRVESLRFRETCWRHEVESRFGKPDRAARKLRQLADEVAQTWKPVSGAITQGDRALRTGLARLVFEGEGGSDSLLRRAENEPHYWAVEMRLIRERIARSNRNPCYLPQLARFQRLVLLTPVAAPGERTFKDRLRSQLAQHRKDLCVVLLPQLSAQLRRETQVWLREANGCLFDDYDLCRLLIAEGRPRPDPLLGFLEIACEQLRWTEFSPFTGDDPPSSADPPRRLEVLVGRRDEAASLALDGRFSRLFAGRKLGKTTLLRSLRAIHDGERLPSGRSLRVVYVTAAGLEDEAAVVDAILSALAEQAAFSLGTLEATTPGERVLEAASRLVHEHPEKSFLILLDEADGFLEEQRRRFTQEKEACLIARIRTELARETDEQGLPRVRVLYAGYRATRGREEPWGDAGDEVLTLESLPTADAIRLLAGPLARMGIDVSEEALPIVYRCGCHPAILLRFGEVLVQRLESLHPPAGRDRAGVRVTAEDTAAVYASPAVQEEIWTVTRGNFQGNDRGFAVVAALLLEFAASSPSTPLEDAGERVLERLRTLGDLDWLAAGDDPLAVLHAHLRDLVERQLLVARPVEGRVRHALRHPHHLPVLVRRDLEQEMRLALTRVREEARQETPRTLLPPAQLADLRSLLFRPGEYPAAGIVVGSLWPRAIEDRVHGLPVWLGLLRHAPEAVVDATDEQLEARARERYLMVRGASPTTVQQVLAARGTGLPPPVFTGGVDLLRWALAERRREKNTFEVAAMGRLGLPVLSGWFRRVRALEFDRSDALAQIAARTSGIPLLVGLLDRLLLDGQGNGQTVATSDLERALVGLDEGLADEVRRLSRDDPAYRLQKRERQLLQMVATVCRENNHQVRDLAEELVLNWELYQEVCPAAAVNHDPASSDLAALELLLLLGLLPGDPARPGGRPLERLLPPPADDAVWSLLEHLRLPT